MPQALRAVATAVAALVLSASPVASRSLRLRDQRSTVVQADAAASSAMRTGIDVDIVDLHVQGSSVEKTTSQFTMLSATVGGHEVGCVNCNQELFARWVRQQQGIREAGCKEDAHRHGGKHPNAPGYDEWSKKNALSFLSLKAEPCNATAAFSAKDVQISVIKDWDLETVTPKLQSLWSQKRLIIGYGPSPLRQHMDFGEVLMSLARNAPMLTPPECPRGDVPHCDAVFSGLRKTGTFSKLENTLNNIFGKKFLADHRYRPDLNTTEQRGHVQAALTELKKNFAFYYQKCLTHEQDTAQCNATEDSLLLGQVACQDQDDEVSDDCVYAELRYCYDCEGPTSFFEYSRFHGPLALFETKSNRKGVMGQCEEFSRAGHALISYLGWEARYVLDFTDHVWIEVQIPKGKHGVWLHADPSEGVLDSPLMYETGWGKQLTMIFAFTPWTVEHITHKYTDNYAATVLRRGIDDIRLDSVLDAVNHRLKYELPLNSWGHQIVRSSKDLTLKEVSLWSHFEATRAPTSMTVLPQMSADDSS
jgi:hypothetical protein